MPKKKKVSLVLTKDKDTLGRRGDKIETAYGYARNYLLPKELAVLATQDAIIQGEKYKQERRKKEKNIFDKVKKLIEKTKDLTLEFKAKVKDKKKKGELYGSITNNDIIEKLAEKNIDIPKHWIRSKQHIKEIGEHNISIKMQDADEIKIKVIVREEK